ncbi:MAG: hypothetical protein DRP29_08340 [Thermodesulfobacteriota bacterium]|nr:MAG: hypothetical protein DRP29_08340 [Thermodesulfobacteriota bacterium]
MCRISSKKKRAKSGKQQVLFDYRAVSDLLSIFSSHFSLDNVNKGKSFFQGMVGKRVFSDMINMCDWGSMKYGNLSRIYDSEGTKTMKTRLINKGVLKGFVSDITSGKGNSTGNCSSMSAKPSVGLSNLVLSDGKSNFKEFIDNFSGVYVVDMMGVHTANPISGDFSLNASSAFLVKKGVIMPLKSFMLSGNAFETFKKVSRVFNGKRQIGKYVCPRIVTEVDVIA